MIEIFFKTIRDDHFEKIQDIRPGSWIHVEQATKEDLEKIIELTGLEMADLQDSLDKYESPRIEMKNGTTLLFIRHPSHIERGIYTANLTMLLTPTFFITISPQSSQIVEMLTKHRMKLATTQKSKLLFYILLEITQNFTNNIKGVATAVIAQKSKTQNIRSEAILHLTQHEDVLNQYLSALVPIKNVFEAITTGRPVPLYEKDKDLLQDLLIAIKQSEDLCRVNVKSINNLRDSYQILFTNDVNKTIKLLTAITIIFTIPTIVSSIFGMNIQLPFTQNPHAFGIILAITLFFCIISVIVFLRKRWL